MTESHRHRPPTIRGAEPSRKRHRYGRLRLLAVVGAALLVLSACSSGNDGETVAAADGSDLVLASAAGTDTDDASSDDDATPMAAESEDGGEDGHMSGLPVAFAGEFPRLPADTVMPTGQSVSVDCQEDGVDYPYSPYDWPDAAATLEVRQGEGRSVVKVAVEGVRPDTYYTMWVRFLGEDPAGNTYGGNPLMGIPGGPLIPSSELADALDAVGNPNDRSTSGFHSDADGVGSVTIDLDFPVVGGAYPFDRFEGFDATDERYKAEAPSIPPVAIAMTGAPFTLRLASHCKDGVGHGLLPGPHEGWFDWSAAHSQMG